MGWTLAVDVGDTSTGVAVADDGTTGTVRWVGRLRTPVPSRPGVTETMPARALLTRSPHGREAVAAVLRTVVARRGHPARVVLVHPAAWAGDDLTELREAALLAGLPTHHLVAAPVAAVGRLGRGEQIVVYDVGGHGSDVAVVTATRQGAEVVAAREAPEPFGGVDLDDVLRWLVTEHAANRDPEGWASAHAALDDDATGRRDLLATLTAAREALSTDRSATVAVPGLAEPVLVTRHEFETRAEPELTALLDRLDEVVTDAGFRHTDLTGAVVTGGVARTPILVDLVTARFGGRVRIDPDPESTAVRGALVGAPTPGRGPLDDELDAYFSAPTEDRWP